MAAAPETRERAGFHLPFRDLDAWARWALPGCAAFCRAFGLRHPVYYRHLAKTDASALRDEAESAWLVPDDDWNGGR